MQRQGQQQQHTTRRMTIPFVDKVPQAKKSVCLSTIINHYRPYLWISFIYQMNHKKINLNLDQKMTLLQNLLRR